MNFATGSRFQNLAAIFKAQASHFFTDHFVDAILIHVFFKLFNQVRASDHLKTWIVPDLVGGP